MWRPGSLDPSRLPASTVALNRRNARCYLVAEGLSSVTTGAFDSLLALYVLAHGHDARFLGLLLTLGLAGAGAAALPAGTLVDRLTPRRVLLGSSVVAAVGVALQLLAPGTVPLVAGTLVAGVGAAAFGVAAPPFLVQLAPPGRRAALFSWDTAIALGASAAGSAAAGQCAGLLLGQYHLPKVDAYRLTLLGAGIIGVWSFLALWRTTEPVAATAARVAQRRAGHPHPPAAPASLPTPDHLPEHWPLPRASHRPAAEAALALPATISGSWQMVRPDRTALRLAITSGLIGLGAGLFLPYVNVYLVEGLGASPALFGWLSAAATLLRLGATALAPRLSAAAGPARAIASTQLASVPLLLTLGFAPQLPLAAAAYVTRGAVMNMGLPLQASFIMDRLPLKTRGAGNAFVWVCASAARAVGTAAGGALIAAAGYRLPYALTAVLYVASAALFWHWFAHASRPLAKACERDRVSY